MTSVPRKIIHIDMDAFYASVEQRDDPSLKGRPLAVDHGARRGVVAAASYEARQFGVRSAMPSTTALRQCPQLVFVPPRFEVYKAVSRQIHEIFADYADLIEPLSLDEAYLDVTANRAGLATATDTAKEIRARILEATGLTASAGISYNKFLAKLASDQRKPNGQFVVPPGKGEAFVQGLPISRFHGVGAVTEAKMKRLGVYTGIRADSGPSEPRSVFGQARLELGTACFTGNPCPKTRRRAPSAKAGDGIGPSDAQKPSRTIFPLAVPLSSNACARLRLAALIDSELASAALSDVAFR